MIKKAFMAAVKLFFRTRVVAVVDAGFGLAFFGITPMS
jgi:hypothetical protein